MIFGPDVSDWQGDVDWPAVRASGRLFAFVKATERANFVAETLEANRRGMADAGLLLRGLYHFAHPELHDPGTEASWFLRSVGDLRPAEVPVLDIEEGDPAGWEAWAAEWLAIVEDATGRTPVVYMSSSYADQYGMGRLTRYPLWVAAYGANNGRVPGWGTTWTAGAWPRWTFWQYSSKATVPGVDGICDDSVFVGTEAELAALAGTTTPAPPQPQEEVTMIVFDGPPERGGGVWKSDGIWRNRINAGETWPALEKAGAKHIGVAPVGLFDDLIDADELRGDAAPGGVDLSAIADRVAARLADLLAARLAS